MCASPVRRENQIVRLGLYFTSNRQGEVEPCGCQVNQIGGLSRMKSYLEMDAINRPGEKPLFVDSGDTFFSSSILPKGRVPYEMDRARLISQAYRKFGVEYFGPGERDFAAGVKGLRELEDLSGAQFISSNLADTAGVWLFKRYVVISKNGLKIGLFSLADENAFSDIKEVKPKPYRDVVQSMINEMKGQGAEVLILLSHLGLNLDREVANDFKPDIIVGSHSMDALSKPLWVGKTLIVQPHHEGQQIGVLDYSPQESEKSTLRLVDLGSEYDRPNEVASLVDSFREKVRSLGIETSNQIIETTAERPFVAHPYQCRSCHQKQYDFWEKTKHSSAYLVLYSKNQHFDPECISCHSLGFQSAGGFFRIAEPLVVAGPHLPKTPFVEELMKKVFIGEKAHVALDSRKEPKRFAGLQKRYIREIRSLEERDKIQKLYIGVQCEHCHGNRQGHPAVPVRKGVSEASCRVCHSPPNDEDFDFKSVKRVGCPRSKKL